jgi:hypothetical protein
MERAASRRRAGRGWRDWLLVAVVVAAAVAEGVLRDDLPSPAAVPVLIGIGLAPTLLWRRTHPLLMVAIAFPVCALGEVVVGGDLRLNTLVFLTILLFSLARWGSGREAVIGTAIVATKIGLSTFAGLPQPRQRPRRRTGGLRRAGHRRRPALPGRGPPARAGPGQAAGAGTAGPRPARHGGPSRVGDGRSAPRPVWPSWTTQPGAAADALRVIEAEASRALAEMRTMVRALRRDEPADRRPRARVADIAELTSGSGSRPGPVVEVELGRVTLGTAAALGRGGPSTGWPRSRDERLKRHARHATRIQVWVAARRHLGPLCASATGRRGRAGRAGAAGSPGYGLIGMIERADLPGGTVAAGPNPRSRPGTVTATLPDG